MSDSKPEPASPTDADEPTSPFAVPRQTTPVWESETLLSIGLVIGLMQFPPLLDALLLWGTVRLGSPWQPLLTFTFLYAKVALYALIVTFVVHLILRGFWVAALGMRAVFPQAIDWEKVSKGRISREFAKANTPSLTQVAERNDNAASAMFAFGFLLFGLTAMIMLVTLLSAAIGAGIALAIPGLSPVTAIFALIAVVVVPMIVGQTIDRYFGARIAPGSGAERALRWLLIPGLRLFNRPTVNGLMVPLIGRMGHFKAMLIILGALYALIAVVSMQMAVLRGESTTDSYTFVPDSNGQLVLDPRHYASQRREPRLQASSFPFVQSDLITEPYLRLFVPYNARRLNTALPQICPGLASAAADSVDAEKQRRQQILDCAWQLFAPRLDDQPIVGLGFEFATDPESGQSGFVAMIPLRGLAPGRHALTLSVPPLADEDPPASDDDRLFRIPFWL